MDVGNIKEWAGLIRDVGLIIGIPVIIGVGVKLYGQQIEILKARNELLKETQYDRALSIIKSQKEVFEIERQSLEKKVADLETQGEERTDEVDDLTKRLKAVGESIQALETSQAVLGSANFSESLFREPVTFRAAHFNARADFSYVMFDDYVSFQYTAFKGPVLLDGADLRRASLREADLRGVDLSEAIIDSKTILPKK